MILKVPQVEIDERYGLSSKQHTLNNHREVKVGNGTMENEYEVMLFYRGVIAAIRETRS